MVDGIDYQNKKLHINPLLDVEAALDAPNHSPKTAGEVFEPLGKHRTIFRYLLVIS
jgi:hypothetical protein